MEARRHAGGAAPPRGVSGHASFTPCPGQVLPPASGSIAVDGKASRQAHLPAVGVTAQHERVAQSRRFPVGFGGMGEEDRRFTDGNRSACPCQIVGSEEVGIVDATDPEAGVAKLQRQGFVKQEGESRLLERGDLGKEIMVAEDRETFRVEEGNQPLHRRKRAVEGTVNLCVVIAGQDNGVVRNGRHDLGDPLHDPVIEIAVEVGELEEAESLEGLGEAGDHGLMFLDTEIEDIS